MSPREIKTRDTTQIGSCSVASMAIDSTQQPSAVKCPGQAGIPSLLDATLEDLQQGLEAKLFTSVDLVNAYTARIEEVRDELKAVREINPDALRIAQGLDMARAEGNIFGPLHGIPILVKDNISTDDNMDTTAGSYALAGARFSEDSTVARSLRKNGAIILGKTNMCQWAGLRGTEYICIGWSATGGQTVGSYFQGQTPGGSSGGSGVASSIGLAFACLGTETFGSITRPAELNNIVGIKPSVGLTSRHGVVPYTSHQDTVGTLARTVKDGAHLLTAIAGRDSNDPCTGKIPFAPLPDYVAACKRSGLAGKRIGVTRKHIHETLVFWPSTSDCIEKAFDKALDALRSAGATVVDNIDSPELTQLLGKLYDLELITHGAEFRRDLQEYLSKLKVNPQHIRSVGDLVKFTQGHDREKYPCPDTKAWERALEADAEAAETVRKELCLEGDEWVTGTLQSYGLDAFVCPSLLPSNLTGFLGLPVVTVPLGRMPKGTEVAPEWGARIPFGISFWGEKWSDGALIGMAYAFEQTTMHRQESVPVVKPKTDLCDVVRERREAEAKDAEGGEQLSAGEGSGSGAGRTTWR
ncbi:amidase [Podospora aff. communis PSN243]|uniref:Amidase n=1 Tax=Podospora aff. communis PSN243 TaxID=3040156 RepID=A0AAV9GHE3_9PEZI|nr:amidase [Podospora aff. communis PSN243]